jgi:peptide-methionine (S)-S-oxide reductase
VGYAGGKTPDPTYRRIGDHSETIQIDYDPSVLSYRDLLKEFWSGHDPTRPTGSRQYMSAIFVHDEEQRKLAEETKAEAEKAAGEEIHTRILPFTRFTRAEDYHQKYMLRGTRDVMRDFHRMYAKADDFTDSTAAARVNGFLGGHGDAALLESLEGKLGLSETAWERLGRAVRRK